MKYIIHILIVVLSFSATAQTLQFDEANTLYNEGKYVEAIAKYESILKSKKHSADLYFNLANAHYKLNNIAPSIYYYEKALILNPNDADIKNNYPYAQNMTVDAIETVPEIGLSKFVKKATKIFSFDAWATLSVSLVVTFVLLFLVYYFAYTTNRKRFAFVGSLTALFLAFIALGFTFYNYNLTQKDNPAIVFAQETQVKSEPNLRSDEAFVLHEGTKVQVIDSINNWNKIKLTDGKIGWIISEDIKLLKDF